MSEVLTGIYVIGLVLGIAMSAGTFMVDVMYDTSPRKALARLLRHLAVSIAWPVVGPVWVFLVCYKDRWDVL